MLRLRLDVGCLPGLEFGHVHPSPRRPWARRPLDALAPTPKTVLVAELTPAGCVALIVCRGGALPSPCRPLSPPHPLFSPPLAPSLPPSPPLHLQRPAARRAQFRPTAWHPSACAVCLGLGESNQERRLQFSGRAVRGASSLLFIHQQRRADPGLALACRRPRPLSALGSTLRRGRSPCSAPTRGSATFFSCSCSALSFPLLPTRRGPRLRLSRPRLCGPRSAPRGCLPPLPALAAPRFPGHRVPTSDVFSPLRSAYLRAALSPSYLGAKGREPQSGGQRDFFLAL